LSEPEFRVGDDGEIEYIEYDFQDEKPKRKSKPSAIIGRKVTLQIPLIFLVVLLIPVAAIGFVLTQQNSTAIIPAMIPTFIPSSFDALPFCSDIELAGNDRIVFSGDDYAYPDLFLTEATGENSCRLTKNAFSESSPRWSPDGKQIAFASTREGRVDVYVMDAKGLNVRNITEQCRDGSASPDWSPDGKQIIFTSSCFGEAEGNIYVMNSDGLNIQRLTDAEATDTLPQWSPDGRFIAFVSTRDGIGGKQSAADYELYIMNANGAAVRRVTHNRLFDSFPVWSDSGDVLVFESHEADNTAKLLWDWDPFNYGSGDSQPQLIGSMPPFSSRVVWLQDDTIAFLGSFDGATALYTSQVAEIENQHQRVTDFGGIKDFDWWQRSQ
jgi:dipeptidyl aminopeptidase/acylaminoacyl peptidase